jgi:polar amino acid transport system substrate-binding protein
MLFSLIQCSKDKYPENGNPEEFKYFTEENPPFNYSENGSMTGASVEILESLFTGLELSIDRSVVESGEWASAYDKVLSTPNTMLFSMVKTMERTPLFKWVGPIAAHTEIIVSLVTSGVQIKEITDLNNYFVGVVDGYSSIDLLMSHGIYRANIIIYNTLSDLYKALVVDHEIQCISTSLSGHNLMVKDLGYSAGDFSTPYTVRTDDLYFAFNIDTADEMIVDFQNQLTKLKTTLSAEGTTEYAKILKKYNL